MPQPISKIPGYFGVMHHIAGGSSPLEAHPKIATAIADVLAAWGGLELAQLQAYTALVGVRQKLAAQIFMNLNTAGPKKSALRTMAEYRLNKWQFEIFLGMLDLIKEAQDERDKVVHWVYGVIHLEPKETDTIMPVSKDYISLTDPRHVYSSKSSRRSYAYSVNDFERMRDHINDVASIVSYFVVPFHQKSTDERNQRFRKLSERPRLAEVLARRANKRAQRG